jgi:hypothetical protein
VREWSPQALARAGGLLYLVIIVVAGFGEAFVRESLVVSGDAAATAARIRASELSWRLSIAGNMVHLACAVGLTLVFYVLFRDIHRHLALLMVFFNLISIGLEIASKLFLVAVLLLLDAPAYLRAFDTRQLEALAYLAVRLHGYGFAISLIFFAGTCLLLGNLITISTLVPRILGPLMLVAGLSYLVNSFALLVAPGVAGRLFPAILIPPFVGESALCLWMLARGVKVPAGRR